MKIVKEHIGFHYLLIFKWHYLLYFTAVYFDSSGIECTPQEVLNKIKDEWITHNIFTIQDNESIMCGFYCITFIEYMLGVEKRIC